MAELKVGIKNGRNSERRREKSAWKRRKRTVISEEIHAARPCSCSWNKNKGKKDKVYKSFSHIHRREQEQVTASLWSTNLLQVSEFLVMWGWSANKTVERRTKSRTPPPKKKRKVQICHETMKTTISRSAGCRVEERKAEDTNSGFLTFDYDVNNKSSQAVEFGIISMIIISTVTFNCRLKIF